MSLPVQVENSIEDILDNFDFSKVRRVMKYLEWEWYLEDGVRIPRMEDLMKAAKKHLVNAYREAVATNVDNFVLGSGGFEVRVYKEVSGAYTFALRFIVSEWNTYE